LVDGRRSSVDQRFGHDKNLPDTAVSRLMALLAGLALVGVLATGWWVASSGSPLTADEWAWCQGHWRDGLDASQQSQPQAGTWFFNHMGFRENPDTIQVCRRAAGHR